MLGSGIIFSWLLALVVHLTQAQWRKIKQVEGLLQNLRQEMGDRIQSQQELQSSYRLLESMIEGICTPIFVKNSEGYYVFLNQSMAQLFAKPKSLILGRSDRKLLASFPELLAVLVESDRRILQSGQPETFEADWPQARQLRYLLIAKSVWRNGSGEIIGLLGVANDITERTQTEIQLRYSEERYRSLVIATSQIVWITNAQGEIITPQPSWSTYTGQGIRGLSAAGLDKRSPPPLSPESARAMAPSHPNHLAPGNRMPHCQ
ncbi:MAG: PAS domain-containing protein [Chloroflexaceae bacterium]|nr:PAS domain-containing protein [Chloroflexaceae bacterium]